MPIKFRLDVATSPSSSSAVEIHEVKSQFIIDIATAEKGEKKVLTGTITNETGSAVAGANIVHVGTTDGTVSDVNGNFNLSVPKVKKQLTISFIGYETVLINFY